MMLWEIYTWDTQFAHTISTLHEARILEGNKRPAWHGKYQTTSSSSICLVPRSARNTNSSDHKNGNTRNALIPSTEVCFNWNSETDCPSNCRFFHQCTNCAGNYTKSRCASRPSTNNINNANATPIGRRPLYQPQYDLEVHLRVIPLILWSTPADPIWRSRDPYK